MTPGLFAERSVRAERLCSEWCFHLMLTTPATSKNSIEMVIA